MAEAMACMSHVPQRLGKPQTMSNSSLFSNASYVFAWWVTTDIAWVVQPYSTWYLHTCREYEKGKERKEEEDVQ